MAIVPDNYFSRLQIPSREAKRLPPAPRSRYAWRIRDRRSPPPQS
ncbi:hypothetical protein DAD186_07400 [Dermabacter vaginalis]|uniref:Uncharacterized protein n=1 Tax=Dermabacter vaginalis TaxID=1630135 RepID=A0A1B0ZH98_9MICO|nr:hypothetical protein DAD186_07400 [Dermabacter vaginalis]